jgi:hypothetical protein
MSVKFKEETIRTSGAAASAAAVAGGKQEDFMHEVGEAITKGGGPNGYLAVRRAQLGVPLELC